MNGGDRLRVTLLERISTVENARRSVTLEDVLMADMTRSSQPIASPSPARNNSNHSLLDVLSRDRRRVKTTWKSLRDKLRIRRNATTWISSNLIPMLDNDSHRRNRLGFLLSSSESNRSSGYVSNVVEEGRLQLGTVLDEERAMSVQPPRISLMELLEDNDGQMFDVNEGEEADERGEMVSADMAELGCCVCMIRSKGAAFIPCGHTFCRSCSRELWVQRGNCPLCNTYILQVLDIF